MKRFCVVFAVICGLMVPLAIVCALFGDDWHGWVAVGSSILNTITFTLLSKADWRWSK